jgi:membrane protein required for colicin V production
LSGIDFVICALLIVGAFVGYKEGFLLGLFSFLAIVLGVMGGFALLGWAMLMLDDSFDIDKKILPYVAFGVVFLAIVLVVRLLANLIKLSIDKTFLGKMDQAAGALLGVFRAAFMLSVVLWILDAIKISLPEDWMTNSWLYPPVAAFAPLIGGWIGDVFPAFQDIFSRF